MTHTPTSDTLILALGSPLRGDDGVGSAVLGCLPAAGLPSTVDTLDGGTPGLETALLLQAYRRVVIIDAADMGLAPGAWRRFTSHDAVLPPALHSNLHQAGLADALVLGEALGILPVEVIIYGIQPYSVDWSEELSTPVEAAVPGIAAAIVEEITASPFDRLD